MSTHCFIGRAHPDSKVRAIYVHFDGDPSKKYPLLSKHLSNEQRLDRILDGGDLNSLQAKPSKRIVARAVVPGPESLYVELFHPKVAAREYANMAEFLRGASEEAAVYAYLWIEGMWISFRASPDGTWKTLPITPGWTEPEMDAYCLGAP
jgi:hypothetical protein